MSQFSLNALKFEDIRQNIVNYLKDNSEFSSVFDFEGSNIGMILDTMAYVTMMMSYQVSNVTNNLFLDTTELRKNAVSIAKTMGYRPKRIISAKITGTIRYSDATKTFTSADKITIPAQTIFTADTGHQFVNINPIYLTVSSSDENVLEGDIELFEGGLKSFTYLGTGVTFQSFTIPSTRVEENNMFLYVRKNSETNRAQWEEVKQSFNLIDEKSYFVEEDVLREGQVKILFGDGSVGDFPESDEIVEIDYLESSGEAANDAVLLSFDTSNIIANFVGYSVDNILPIGSTTTKAYGGKPYETLLGIQQSAPKSFAMAGRAVTKNDYITLLSNNSYIHRTNVIGGDELFAGNNDKLGNIYMTAIPLYIDLNNILDSVEIYLNAAQETSLLTELNKFRIISTNIQFMKPSYIYVNATPTVEIPSGLNSFEEEKLVNETTNQLSIFVSDAFDQFNPIFRASRLNSVIGQSNNVLSSTIDFEYNFILSRNSFYVSGEEDVNVVYLPIRIEAKDANGQPTSVSNFVKTNLEQRDILGLGANDFLEYEDRTIYGPISNSNVDRFLYNEDIVSGGVADKCYLKLKGDTQFFSLRRFEPDYSVNTIDTADKVYTSNGVTANLTVTPEYLGTAPDQTDNYELNIGSDSPFGIVTRTASEVNGFGGIVRTESDIANNTDGVFYEAGLAFSVSGSDKSFTNVEVGEYIIYDAALSGGIWKKTNYLGMVDGGDSSTLFTNVPQNTIYDISVSGDFSGYLVEPATAGDYIIFNGQSTVNPNYKWEILETQSVMWDGNSYGLDASLDFPIEATDYELRKVTNIVGTTNFGGRTDALFEENDIIMFNPSPSADDLKWQLIVNSTYAVTAASGNIVEASPISGGSLEDFDYDPVSGVAIGDWYLVTGIGNFGDSYTRVNWNGTIKAFDNDILVYVGNERWNIYQPSYPQVFNIDADLPITLPVSLTYGDLFTVEISGDFNGLSSTTYQIGDGVVYVGSNTWIPLNSVGSLDASTSNNLPQAATIGDVVLVQYDGNFDNSYIIAPSGQEFIQGDYMIFNGESWGHMKEYTFEYLDMDVDYTGRDYLNDLGFNYVFNYRYNGDETLYEFYFNDVFSDTIVGTFVYNTSTPETSLFEVGKITWNLEVSGSYDINTTTNAVSILTLFDNTDLNLIRFLPKNKVDINGNITTEEFTDFDTYFNEFVVVNVNQTETVRY